MKFPDEAFRDICCIKTLYSTTEGFFKDFVGTVFEEIDPDWINNVFKNQITEKEKIRLCCNEPKVWDTVQNALKNIRPVYRKKCADASNSGRLDGDCLCQAGDYAKAVMIYSQSIIRAPSSHEDKVREDYSLALAYRGRANALFHLKRYQECLTDLNMALKEGFPFALKYQIFYQMGKCYKELLELGKAQISLQLAIKLIDEQILKLETTAVRHGTKSGRSKDSALKKMLDEEREEMKQVMRELPLLEGEPRPESDSTEVQYIGGVLPCPTGQPNEKYPNASSLVAIRQTVGAGRFAVAADKIDTGATLVVEEPQASVLIPQMIASHCLHCFTRLYTPVPCKICSGVAFCSVSCRDLATYHKYECEFMGMFLGSGMSILSLLALRMVTQESLKFFKQLHSKIQELKNSGSSVSVCFSHRETQYMHVYNLTTHSQLRTGNDYFRRTLMAIFLVECLKKTDFFEAEEREGQRKTLSEDEILAASLILRHLELLQFNAHEIYETRMTRNGPIRNAKAVFIAVGIYPTVALFNHECAPSVIRYFNGKNIVIKAVRPLKKGEILSENYGPHYAKKILHDRIRELTSRYWFWCECRACSEDWPLVENLTPQLVRIRCSTLGCRGSFPHPQSTENSDAEHSCPHCLKKTDVSEALRRKNQIEILFDKALDYMENRNCARAVPLLMSYLDEMFQLVTPPCREIFLSQEALRTCCAQTGNIWLLDM